jgi:inner membrane protein
VDSLSQIVLGAAVGELMLGKRLGNKGQLLGAIAGTIPDLDIFLNFLGHTELEKLTIHRGYSHALFTHFFLALPFAWVTWKWFKEQFKFSWWYLFWLLGFVTHVLLDSFTTYGTQLLLPFSNFLIGFNNIAVVDVFWTLPFLILLAVCLFMKRSNPKRRKFALASVTYAVLYIGMTFFNKYQVHSKMTESLRAQHIRYDELSTTPNFFHNFLWSGVAMTNDSIYFSEYSILQNEDAIQWAAVPRHLELIENHPAKKELDTIKWFSQGKYLVQQNNDSLRVFVAKWGRMDFRESDPSKAIFFYFNVYEKGGQWHAEQSSPDQAGFDVKEALKGMYNRVWTSQLD